jgi:regulation of enolase protein 1 (concanavalin A-like superfamily)
MALAIVIATCASTHLIYAQAPLLPAVSIAYTGFETGDVWPADFNKDGITDLVGRAFDHSRHVSTLAVARGHGDGTYDAPITSAYQATPWAVGDLNRDGKIDVLAVSNQAPNDRRTLLVVSGNGDGTLGPASTIASTNGPFTFALVIDIDGNGTRDIVAGEEPDGVSIYTGNGDLTFSPPFQLVTGRGPRDGIAADFNGDGLRDIAVANDEGQTLSIFLNGGGLLFSRRDVAVDRPTNDITVRDLTGDGIVDLVLAGAAHDKELFAEGRVYVLAGNGNGTFEPPDVYDTGRGAFRVVVGDFTHDGRLDIATGNRAAVSTACGGSRLTYWDTVSILEGRSDGTFAPAVNFSLATDFEPFDPTFINTLTSLNTSDLDGDGHTDLIASGGAILLSRAPRANSAPAAQPEPLFADGPIANVLAHASDPDFHALTFTWTNEEGQLVGTEPSPCVAVPTGDSVFTLTVDDGHGGIASETVASFLPTEQVLEIVSPSDFDNETILHTDEPYEIRWRRTQNLFSSFDVFVQDYGEEGGAAMPVPGCQNVPGTANGCTWQLPGPASMQHRQFVVRGHRNDNVRDAIDSSAAFEVMDSGAQPLPPGWQASEVGAASAAGSARSANGVFTIAGSGADIWDTADEFHWVHQAIDGDFEVIARVLSVENVDRWVKAGLMIRASGSDAAAAHASVFATPGKGIAFQRRRSGGEISVHTAGPLLAAPVWLRLVRSGSSVVAYSRRDASEGWSRIGEDTIALGRTVQVGLAVSSHVDGTLASASFDSVTIEPGQAWQSATIGVSTVAGSALESNSTFTVRGGGADIWGAADGFQFVYKRMSGDGSVTARVASLQNTNAWAKAGVMIRDGTSPGARHAFSLVSAARGTALQFRPTTGGASASGAIVEGAAPRWVKLERRANTFISSVSIDGSAWQEIGRTTIPMSAEVLAGLAVTSHNPAALAAAVFDDVRFVR